MEIMESTKNSKKSVELAYSPVLTDELKYLYASNVNVSNFVSVKLSGKANFRVWEAQMVCLMKSQKMLGIADSNFDGPGANSAMPRFIKEQYDSLLKGWIFGSITEELLTTVVDLDSASAVWRKLKLSYDGFLQASASRNPFRQTGPEDSDSEITITLDGGEGTSPLLVEFTLIEGSRTTQARGRDTPHHIKLLKAAAAGRWWEAESILQRDRWAARVATTYDGNTMLHVAVANGHNDFVKELLDFIDDGKEIEKQNSDGRTALHIAAIFGNTYAVKLLVNKRKELLGLADHNALVPLLSAYYNMKLDTFAYLLKVIGIKQQTFSVGFYPDPGIQTGASFLITLIFKKQYDLASAWVDKCPELVTKDDQVLMAMAKTFPPELGMGEALIYPSLNNAYQKLVKRCSLLFHSYEFLYAMAKDILWAKRKSKNIYYRRLLPEIIVIVLVPAAMFYPIYQLIRLLILVFLSSFSVLYFIVWKVLATIVAPIKHIDKKNKDYVKAKKVLSHVCDHIDKESSFSGSDHPCYSRPILEAVCQGAHEVVNEILSRLPKAIRNKNTDGYNMFQLAVLNRSERAYNLICHSVERVDLSVTDSSKNNILHLAGRVAPSFVLSRATGAALQLQRELQWFKEVEKFMLPTEIIDKNVDMETPDMVFTREHKHLVTEGEKWIKTTAESCSITAALITTIVFAAAITVPGGSNQETGIPLFRKELAFTIFAISDAISLFASATALLVFLSILTARFSEQDFLVSLPRRLMIGLCVLFLSTSAMMVAFSAILFLVFCDQRAWMMGPIGGLACVPIAVVVTLQFPLVVDLYRSTYHPFLLADCSEPSISMVSYFGKKRI
ncbi:hypothetical protein OSB04_014975 [Centaurea solstitialis]|uniref:PGG domain-containing protein n=1 Tax=Centaurea solstitialis TaxID=347529 RepID=A0AA38TA28_9ASTR|nr:hypothetical protein OSB04_014975 [Centaurea solstitialis]